MNQASVISVDPGKSTLGDLNPIATARALRRRVLNRDDRDASYKRKLNGLFAIGQQRMASSDGISSMLVRIMAGALLIYSGLATGFGEMLPTPEVIAGSVFQPSVMAVAQLAAGVALCLGLMTRVVLTAAAVCFGVLFGQGIASGEFLHIQALLCVLSLVFAVKGPGNISIDALIRRSLYAAHRRRCRRRAERRLSYEAFRYANH